MTVRMAPLPQFVAILLVGPSNVKATAGPLPLDLSPFGFTYCWLRVSPDINVLLTGSAGSASYALAVPTNPALAGLILHLQALVPDTAAGNPAGLVVSDAATAVVGM